MDWMKKGTGGNMNRVYDEKKKSPLEKRNEASKKVKIFQAFGIKRDTRTSEWSGKGVNRELEIISFWYTRREIGTETGDLRREMVKKRSSPYDNPFFPYELIFITSCPEVI